MAAPSLKNIDKNALFIWNDTTKRYEAWDGVLNTGDIEIGAVELKDGDSDRRADVEAANGYNALIAIAPGHVSTDNSTATPLGADATYTGTWEDITNFGVIVITVYASHASATDGLMVEFSSDGTNIDSSDTYTIPATTGKTFSFQSATQYFRVKYTNGSTLQTEFRLQTTLKPYYVKPSSHRIQDNIIDDDDGELGLSVLKLRTAQDNYVSGAATGSGNFKVSLEELESGISTNSNSQLNVTPYSASGDELNGATLAMRTDDVGGGVTYQGWAVPGTATSAASWKIRRITEAGDPSDFTIEWADGDASFNNIWDNRAALSYS